MLPPASITFLPFGQVTVVVLSSESVRPGALTVSMPSPDDAVAGAGRPTIAAVAVRTSSPASAPGRRTFFNMDGSIDRRPSPNLRRFLNRQVYSALKLVDPARVALVEERGHALLGRRALGRVGHHVG